MLTQTLPMSSSTIALALDQDETQVSDAEISRRVLNIRKGWSLSERIQRRREAERRFAELISRLGQC